MKIVLQRLFPNHNDEPFEVPLSKIEETQVKKNYPAIALHGNHQWSIKEHQEVVFQDKPIEKMHIVYFGNLAVPRQTPQKLLAIVSGQLASILRSGFLKCEQNILHIHLVLPHPRRVPSASTSLLRRLGIFRHPRVEVRFSFRNAYEFPGIAWVYALAAVAGPNDLIGYCHSKGASHKTSARQPRLPIEKALTQKVICAWRRVKTIFSVMPNLKIAAITTSSTSIGWFNFWWARPSHLLKQGMPVRNPVRKWWWEVWLAQKPAPVNEQLNLQAYPRRGMFSIGSTYSRGFTLDGSRPHKIIQFYDR